MKTIEIPQNIHIGKKALFENDQQVLTIAENRTAVDMAGPDTLKQSVIYFYFCLEGKAGFGFGPHYSREITEGKTYFFYNPERELPFWLTLSPGTRMVVYFAGGHSQIIYGRRRRNPFSKTGKCEPEIL
jgi:hypothetical protein